MENFSPDNCFDEMAKVLMPDREPTEVGYIELLEEVKKLKKSKEYERVSLLRKIAELKEENEELKKDEEDVFQKMMSNALFGYQDSSLGPIKMLEEVNRLKQENEKLKLLTDGIMNEEGTGHILGCNAYEKFCQAITELNYDERWITEAKKENTDLSDQIDELGVLCENIDENAFKTWKEITGREDHVR